jgi:metal-dependent amidase/aminoacylase/carboxypeptidase family protein
VTVRSNDTTTRNMLIAGIERVAKGVAMANGAPEPTVKVVESTPVTVNNAPLARRINAAFIRELGAAAVPVFQQRDMGAEDFAHFVAAEHNVPGYYFAVGGTPQAAFDAAKAGGPAVAGHHSPLFKIDPRASVVTGATAMTIAVMELLGKK